MSEIIPVSQSGNPITNVLNVNESGKQSTSNQQVQSPNVLTGSYGDINTPKGQYYEQLRRQTGTVDYAKMNALEQSGDKPIDINNLPSNPVTASDKGGVPVSQPVTTTRNEGNLYNVVNGVSVPKSGYDLVKYPQTNIAGGKIQFIGQDTIFNPETGKLESTKPEGVSVVSLSPQNSNELGNIRSLYGLNAVSNTNPQSEQEIYNYLISSGAAKENYAKLSPTEKAVIGSLAGSGQQEMVYDPFLRKEIPTYTQTGAEKAAIEKYARLQAHQLAYEDTKIAKTPGEFAAASAFTILETGKITIANVPNEVTLGLVPRLYESKNYAANVAYESPLAQLGRTVGEGGILGEAVKAGSAYLNAPVTKATGTATTFENKPLTVDATTQEFKGSVNVDITKPQTRLQQILGKQPETVNTEIQMKGARYDQFGNQNLGTATTKQFELITDKQGNPIGYKFEKGGTIYDIADLIKTTDQNPSIAKTGNKLLLYGEEGTGKAAAESVSRVEVNRGMPITDTERLLIREPYQVKGSTLGKEQVQTDLNIEVQKQMKPVNPFEPTTHELPYTEFNPGADGTGTLVRQNEIVKLPDFFNAPKRLLLEPQGSSSISDVNRVGSFIQARTENVVSSYDKVYSSSGEEAGSGIFSRIANSLFGRPANALESSPVLIPDQTQQPSPSLANNVIVPPSTTNKDQASVGLLPLSGTSPIQTGILDTVTTTETQPKQDQTTVQATGQVTSQATQQVTQQSLVNQPQSINAPSIPLTNIPAIFDPRLLSRGGGNIGGESARRYLEKHRRMVKTNPARGRVTFDVISGGASLQRYGKATAPRNKQNFSFVRLTGTQETRQRGYASKAGEGGLYGTLESGGRNIQQGRVRVVPRQKNRNALDRLNDIGKRVGHGGTINLLPKSNKGASGIYNRLNNAGKSFNSFGNTKAKRRMIR